MLTIHLKPSKLLAIILIVAHSAVAVLLWLLSVPLGFKLIGLLFLVFSLCFYLTRDALLCSAQSAVLLTFSDKVNCTMQTVSGQSINFTVLGSTFVSPLMTVLMLQSEPRSWFSQSVVVMPDAVDAEEFRQLRVLLRWKWRQVSDRDA